MSESVKFLKKLYQGRKRLSNEENICYIKKYQNGDLSILDVLLGNCYKIAIYETKIFSKKYRCDEEDLLSVAILELINVFRKYDIMRNTFFSFASKSIRGALYNFYKKNTYGTVNIKSLKFFVTTEYIEDIPISSICSVTTKIFKLFILTVPYVVFL